MRLDLPPKLWEWLLENKGKKSVQSYIVGVLIEHSETKDTNGDDNDKEDNDTGRFLHNN